MESGKPVIVNLLLKYGADVNSKSKNNSMPLALAIKLENESIVEGLLKAGADTKIQITNYPALVVAMTKKNVAIVSFLLNYKADLNFTFNHNPRCFMDLKRFDVFTPLHIAISEKVSRLLNYFCKREPLSKLIPSRIYLCMLQSKMEIWRL